MDDQETKAPDVLVLYAVRNSKGEWFRAKGYQGYGKTWVPDLKTARIYAKPGPAKTQVTFFAKNFPALPVPELVELVVTEVRVVDQVARVKKAIHKMDVEKQRQHERSARWRVEAAQRDLEAAQKRLEEARQRAPK